VSQFMLAIPMWLLYETGIAVASWLKPAEKKADAVL
jgi:Sec-independent protein secretion pathway component TatC